MRKAERHREYTLARYLPVIFTHLARPRPYPFYVRVCRVTTPHRLPARCYCTYIVAAIRALHNALRTLYGIFVSSIPKMGRRLRLCAAPIAVLDLSIYVNLSFHQACRRQQHGQHKSASQSMLIGDMVAAGEVRNLARSSHLGPCKSLGFCRKRPDCNRSSPRAGRGCRVGSIPTYLGRHASRGKLVHRLRSPAQCSTG